MKQSDPLKQSDPFIVLDDQTVSRRGGPPISKTRPIDVTLRELREVLASDLSDQDYREMEEVIYRTFESLYLLRTIKKELAPIRVELRRGLVEISRVIEDCRDYVTSVTAKHPGTRGSGSIAWSRTIRSGGRKEDG